MNFNLTEIYNLDQTIDLDIKFETIIEKIVAIDDGNHSSNTLTWCSLKNAMVLNDIKSPTNIIIPKEFNKNNLNKNCNYILTNNPRRLFQLVLAKYFTKKPKYGISDTAKVSQGCHIGNNVFIGHNVVIEENCIIGNNTSIEHNTVIKEGTQIGDNVIIGCNCVIGSSGCGYEKNHMGDYEPIPHIGNVIIKNNVEIGQLTCIDRAVIGSTLINENVKIDNQIHIAHGVKIGRNTIITAHAMIGGSSIIGENVWIAPSAAILNKISIGKNSLIGLGAVVIKHVEENDVVAGNPAKFLKKLK